MTPFSSRAPRVSVVTAHGRQDLAGAPGDRLFDLLAKNGVPWSAVSIYVAPRDGGPPELRPCLDQPLEAMTDVSDVLLYFNRNVNPFLFATETFQSTGSDSGEAEATEYLYQRLDNDAGTTETWLRKLAPEECRDIVAQRVSDVVTEHLEPGSELVVGVSGGGDSNALLEGLGRIPADHVAIRPIIVKGIPDWDAGVPRAQQLCADYGLDLEVVEEREVKALLGMPDDDVPLVDRFEREFRGDDFEFLGTLIIRLVLGKRAEAYGTRYICTGLNLEDVLCEGLFRISTGMKPASIPAREIGDLTLLFPLWLCPKRIIDGCFPKYSLDNYEARYPCFSLGRNLYYSVIYAMQSQFPGFAERMAQGFSELAAKDPVIYRYDEQLGFHVERFVPFPLRRRFQRMLGQETVSG